LHPAGNGHVRTEIQDQPPRGGEPRRH
jgi:hypothetical protein